MVSEVMFGIHTASPIWSDFDKMSSTCLKAEKYGYDLFTVPDHFMNTQDTIGPKFHQLECWMMLAGLATITQKIKLGPLVCCYAYRKPTVLAKMATTLDIISSGRLIFGIGAGWHEEEFKGYLGRFPSAGERLRGLEETVEICKSMFSKERTTYKGKLFDVENALNSPQPFQRPPPIMIGGGGEKRTLKIVAKHADISHLKPRDLKTLKIKMDVLKMHCKNVNRDFDEIRVGVGFDPILGHDMDEAEAKLRKGAETLNTSVEALRARSGLAFGTPEKVATNLEAYISKGVKLITVAFWFPEDIDLFSEEVLPLIS